MESRIRVFGRSPRGVDCLSLKAPAPRSSAIRNAVAIHTPECFQKAAGRTAGRTLDGFTRVEPSNVLPAVLPAAFWKHSGVWIATAFLIALLLGAGAFKLRQSTPRGDRPKTRIRLSIQ